MIFNDFNRIISKGMPIDDEELVFYLGNIEGILTGMEEVFSKKAAPDRNSNPIMYENCCTLISRIEKPLAPVARKYADLNPAIGNSPVANCYKKVEASLARVKGILGIDGGKDT